MSDITVVHLMRHGEVANPDGILYGRLHGYHLSDLGRRMADRVAEHLAPRDITRVVASPLERAQETATPVAAQPSGTSWAKTAASTVTTRGAVPRAMGYAWPKSPSRKDLISRA